MKQPTPTTPTPTPPTTPTRTTTTITNRTNIAVVTKGQHVQSSHHVRFGTIEIIEIPIILGDNPSCKTFPPIQLGWKVQGRKILDLDVFEGMHTQRRRRRRRNRSELQLSGADRLKMLLRGDAFPTNYDENDHDNDNDDDFHPTMATCHPNNKSRHRPKTIKRPNSKTSRGKDKNHSQRRDFASQRTEIPLADNDASNIDRIQTRRSTNKKRSQVIEENKKRLAEIDAKVEKLSRRVSILMIADIVSKVGSRSKKSNEASNDRSNRKPTWHTSYC